jgi:hypothetical protein
MHWLTRADVLLMAFAAYVAIMTLVRMMKRRRDQLVADVQRQLQARRRTKRTNDADTRNAA